MIPEASPAVVSLLSVHTALLLQYYHLSKSSYNVSLEYFLLLSVCPAHGPAFIVCLL